MYVSSGYKTGKYVSLKEGLPSNIFSTALANSPQLRSDNHPSEEGNVFFINITSKYYSNKPSRWHPLIYGKTVSKCVA